MNSKNVPSSSSKIVNKTKVSSAEKKLLKRTDDDAKVIKKIRSVSTKLRAKNKSLCQRIRELTTSRDGHKEHAKVLKKENKELKKAQGKKSFGRNEVPIARHKYCESVVAGVANICLLGNCSLQGTINIYKYLNDTLQLGLKSIPSKSSLSNWIKKLGLYSSTLDKTEKYKGDYALIVDEFMAIGNDRMLTILIISKDKLNKIPLSFDQSDIAFLKVEKSWTSQKVAKAITKVERKMGSRPAYVISDGDSTLTKAIEDCGLPLIADVGHALARFIEQVYKELPSFKAFSANIALKKSQIIMTDLSYLAPPKQRTIARFMNLSIPIEWAVNMLRSLVHMTDNEEKSFSFLRTHEHIINELSVVFSFVNSILELFKKEGLSHATIEKAQRKIDKWKTLHTSKEEAMLVVKIEFYLIEEKKKLPTATTVYHNSSDIIESLFGKFKHTMASNKNHGITSWVLKSFLFFQMASDSIGVSVKDALEAILLKNIDTWEDDYLLESQVTRRRKLFNLSKADCCLSNSTSLQ